MTCCKVFTALQPVGKIVGFHLYSQIADALRIQAKGDRSMTDPEPRSTRSEELRSFAFLAAVMAPVLTGVLIVSYGFLVWIYQMLIGGPPHA